MFHFVFLEKSMYEVYLIRIQKKSARIRATVCTPRYADCMLKNTFTKHNKYVVIKKLEHFYISFREENVVRRVICKSWHYILIWKTLACPIISLREELLSNTHGLILPLFTEVSVLSKTKTKQTRSTRQSSIYVLVLSMLLLSTNEFGTDVVFCVFEFIYTHNPHTHTCTPLISSYDAR